MKNQLKALMLLRLPMPVTQSKKTKTGYCTKIGEIAKKNLS